MPGRVKRQPAQLAYGYFYEVYLGGSGWGSSTSNERDPPDIQITVEHEGSLPLVYIERCRDHIHVYGRVCSRNPAHTVDTRADLYEFNSSGESKLPPFCRTYDHQPAIINEWLAEQLMDSDLWGWSIQPTRFITGKYDSPLRDPSLAVFTLLFDGEIPSGVQDMIDPPEADRCCFCGHGPVVCPECGYFVSSCEKCQKVFAVQEKDHEGPGDPRLILEPLPQPGLTVFDIRRWDGTDFMGLRPGSWITRRALDFFASIHAGPLLAVPVAVNMENLTAADREKLELTRRPVQRRKRRKKS